MKHPMWCVLVTSGNIELIYGPFETEQEAEDWDMPPWEGPWHLVRLLRDPSHPESYRPLLAKTPPSSTPPPSE